MLYSAAEAAKRPSRDDCAATYANLRAEAYALADETDQREVRLPYSPELRITYMKAPPSVPDWRVSRFRPRSEWCGFLVRAILTLRFHSARFRSLRQQPFGEV